LFAEHHYDGWRAFVDGRETPDSRQSTVLAR